MDLVADYATLTNWGRDEAEPIKMSTWRSARELRETQRTVGQSEEAYTTTVTVSPSGGNRGMGYEFIS
jgi:hypothetical protein